MVSLFALIVVGAYVAAAGFGDACGSSIPSDWPGCLGGLFPPLLLAPVAEYAHRLLAALSGLFLVITTALFWRSRTASKSTRMVLVFAVVLLIGEVLLGGVVIAQEEEATLVAIHQAIATVIFGLVVAAYSLADGPRERF